MAEPQKETEEKEEREPEEKPEPAPKREPKVKEDDDGNVTVDMGSERPPKTRRDRRQESYEELRRARDENQALHARIAQMEAHVQARLSQVEQRVPPADPYEAQMGQIRSQQETIQLALRSGTVTSPAEVDRMRDQFYSLERDSRKLDRDRIKSELREELRPQQRSGDYEEQALRSEFPDVIAHPAAIRWATGTYYQMVAEGKPPTLVTSREAMTKAAERFSLRQAPPPQASPAVQARFGAVPAQAGSQTSNEVRLDTSQKKMAMARWPDLDEHVAYTKMAQLLQKALGETQGDREPG